jgi:single-strand DNA-binding protein
MLKVTLIGNLGSDAEVKDVNNRKVIEFRVAHTDRVKNETVWVRCSLWRDAGKEGVANYLKKGTQVYVEGVPRVGAYISTQTNQPTGTLDVLVNNLELLGGRKDGEGAPNNGGGSSFGAGSAAPANSSYNSAASTTEPEDDLPF